MVYGRHRDHQRRRLRGQSANRPACRRLQKHAGTERLCTADRRLQQRLSKNLPPERHTFTQELECCAKTKVIFACAALVRNPIDSSTSVCAGTVTVQRSHMGFGLNHCHAEAACEACDVGRRSISRTWPLLAGVLLFRVAKAPLCSGQAGAVDGVQSLFRAIHSHELRMTELPNIGTQRVVIG